MKQHWRHLLLSQSGKKNQWLCYFQSTVKEKAVGENRQTPHKHLTWVSVHGFSHDRRTVVFYFVFHSSWLCLLQKPASASGGKDHTPCGIYREESFLVYSNIWWRVSGPGTWHEANSVSTLLSYHLAFCFHVSVSSHFLFYRDKSHVELRVHSVTVWPYLNW